jgi:hypothetical protein
MKLRDHTSYHKASDVDGEDKSIGNFKQILNGQDRVQDVTRF